MTDVRRLARSARYRARYLTSLYPAIYLPYARWRFRGTGVGVVDDHTEVVIEGFGRSGNTFAVDAFQAAQSRPVAIAHHTHAAAQVIEAARRRLPTLLLVREPEAATLSHMIFRDIDARPVLASWVRYHERVLPYRDRILVRRFEEVTTDFGAVIRELNERFGTEFAVFRHTPENEAAVFSTIEARNRTRFADRLEEDRVRLVARPTPERDALKASLRRELADPALAPLRRRARRAYETLVGVAPATM